MYSLSHLMVWVIRNRIILFIIGILFAVFMLSAWHSYQLNGGYSVEWESGFWQNFSTEVLGAITTFILFELVFNQNTNKQRLIAELQSVDKVTASNALDQIKDRGWHLAGTLNWILKNRISSFVMGILFVIFLISLWHSYQLNGGYSLEWESGFWQNFSTEVLGAITTFILFELIVNHNSDKQSLLAQLHSSDKVTSSNALDQIKEKAWHWDGTLKKANMEKLDLHEAQLSSASLQGVSLIGANLRQANLIWANMQKSDLRDADLSEANLNLANMQKSDLRGADLSGANLEIANITDVDLSEVNLAGANLELAKFNQNTTLPDGSKWNKKTDLSRFTDPNHPEFWQPEWVKNKD